MELTRCRRLTEEELESCVLDIDYLSVIALMSNLLAHDILNQQAFFGGKLIKFITPRMALNKSMSHSYVYTFVQVDAFLLGLPLKTAVAHTHCGLVTLEYAKIILEPLQQAIKSGSLPGTNWRDLKIYLQKYLPADTYLCFFRFGQKFTLTNAQLPDEFHDLVSDPAFVVDVAIAWEIHDIGNQLRIKHKPQDFPGATLFPTWMGKSLSNVLHPKEAPGVTQSYKCNMYDTTQHYLKNAIRALPMIKKHESVNSQLSKFIGKFLTTLSENNYQNISEIIESSKFRMEVNVCLSSVLQFNVNIQEMKQFLRLNEFYFISKDQTKNNMILNVTNLFNHTERLGSQLDTASTMLQLLDRYMLFLSSECSKLSSRWLDSFYPSYDSSLSLPPGLFIEDQIQTVYCEISEKDLKKKFDLLVKGKYAWNALLFFHIKLEAYQSEMTDEKLQPILDIVLKLFREDNNIKIFYSQLEVSSDSKFVGVTDFIAKAKLHSKQPVIKHILTSLGHLIPISKLQMYFKGMILVITHGFDTFCYSGIIQTRPIPDYSTVSICHLHTFVQKMKSFENFKSHISQVKASFVGIEELQEFVISAFSLYNQAYAEVKQILGYKSKKNATLDPDALFRIFFLYLPALSVNQPSPVSILNILGPVNQKTKLLTIIKSVIVEYNGIVLGAQKEERSLKQQKDNLGKRISYIPNDRKVSFNKIIACADIFDFAERTSDPVQKHKVPSGCIHNLPNRILFTRILDIEERRALLGETGTISERLFPKKISELLGENVDEVVSLMESYTKELTEDFELLSDEESETTNDLVHDDQEYILMHEPFEQHNMEITVDGDLYIQSNELSADGVGSITTINDVSNDSSSVLRESDYTQANSLVETDLGYQPCTTSPIDQHLTLEEKSILVTSSIAADEVLDLSGESLVYQSQAIKVDTVSECSDQEMIFTESQVDFFIQDSDNTAELSQSLEKSVCSLESEAVCSFPFTPVSLNRKRPLKSKPLIDLHNDFEPNSKSGQILSDSLLAEVIQEYLGHKVVWQKAICNMKQENDYISSILDVEENEITYIMCEVWKMDRRTVNFYKKTLWNVILDIRKRFNQ